MGRRMKAVRLGICEMVAIDIAVGIFDDVGSDGPPATFAQTEITVPTISAVAITSGPEDDDEAYYHMYAVLPLYEKGVYGIGNSIEVTVTFDQGVTVTGSPRLEFDKRGTARNAEYDSTDGSAVVFSYTVAVGDSDTDGISIGANKLTLNGGSIREAMDNPCRPIPQRSVSPVGTQGGWDSPDNRRSPFCR